jgi:Uma2 family endonuclease
MGMRTFPLPEVPMSGFTPTETATRLPDHTQLPDSDGSIVENFQEHPQAMLLTETLRPVFDSLHPDGRYAIGQNSGIYYKITDPPLKGCKAPDWFYVPGVPPLLDGRVRRSYVLWQELIDPLLIVEFVSGDGSEERDATPETGKFWVYEQMLRTEYYAIYEVSKASVEVYHLEDRHYQPLSPNARGRFPILPLGIELGIWQGEYQHQNLPWLRAWDRDGVLLPTGDDRARVQRDRADRAEQQAEVERQRAEEARQRAEDERKRAEQLATRLRELGIDPDAQA